MDATDSLRRYVTSTRGQWNRGIGAEFGLILENAGLQQFTSAGGPRGNKAEDGRKALADCLRPNGVQHGMKLEALGVRP